MRLIPNTIQTVNNGSLKPYGIAIDPAADPDRNAQRFIQTSKVDSAEAPVRVKAS